MRARLAQESKGKVDATQRLRPLVANTISCVYRAGYGKHQSESSPAVVAVQFLFQTLPPLLEPLRETTS
jgi:hypothetical protein